MICRWVVENQIGKKDLLIDQCDSKQTVYIFGCKDSVIQIKGTVPFLISVPWYGVILLLRENRKSSTSLYMLFLATIKIFNCFVQGKSTT